MAGALNRAKSTYLLAEKRLLLLCPVAIVLIFFLFKPSTTSSILSITSSLTVVPVRLSAISPFDCTKCPQASPVFANFVEGVKYPFLYSLADIGTWEKPQKNIVRMLKGKQFRRPDISAAMQEALEMLRSNGRDGVVIDVGANIGMATFAATAMGIRVLAFEPVFENLQRICDGIYLNRAASMVTVFDAAASDQLGHVTLHKLVGRLDNSAISEASAKLAFKTNERVALHVKTIPLDEVIPESVSVLLLKIDVQGWEYHVLNGAIKLLSRTSNKAPYVIYEEDERLLQASNSSVKKIRDLLHSVGYRHCTQHGTDVHCFKDM